MADPVNDLKSAAKSAFTFKNIAIGVFTLFAINVALELLGVGNAFWQPIAAFKAWNDKRKAAAK